MRQTLVGPLSSRSTNKTVTSDPGKQSASKGGTYVGRSYLPSGPSANSGNVANLIGVFNSPSTTPNITPTLKKTINEEPNDPLPPRKPLPTPKPKLTNTLQNESTNSQSDTTKSNPIAVPKLSVVKSHSQSPSDTISKTAQLAPTSNPEKIKRVSANIENRIQQLMDHSAPQKPPPPPRKPLPQLPLYAVQRSDSAPLTKIKPPESPITPTLPSRSAPVSSIDIVVEPASPSSPTSPTSPASFVQEATNSLRKRAGSLLKKREHRPKTAPVSSGDIWKYVSSPVRSGFLLRKISWKDNKDQLWKKSYVVLDVKNIYLFKNERAAAPPKTISLYGAFLKPNAKHKKKFTIITSEGACKFKETETEGIGPWLIDIQKTCAELVASSITEHSKQGSRENASEIMSILSVPGNNICADCGASDPKWGSVNFGVVICIECSGIHRSLGVNTSRVKSIELDNWDTESIQAMKSAGNEKANQEYEKNVPQHIKKPSASDKLEVRELYIRSKYIKSEVPKDYEKYPPTSPLYQRGKVVEEIVTTEGEYLKYLEAIIKYFKKPLESNGLITSIQAETIFCNIDTIRSIHSHLLHLFLEEVKLPDYTPKIAADLEQVMVSSKGEYFTYMAGNEDSINTVNQLMQRSEFVAFCKQASSHHECRNLDLNSLLIKPIQRICKYPLLLKEILKNTEEGSEHEVIEHAPANCIGDCNGDKHENVPYSKAARTQD